MARYYFDLRDGDAFVPDGEGMEFPNVEAARLEAARALADMARDAVRRLPVNAIGYRMAIEVRDGSGPVMQVRFTFEVEPVKQ